MLTFSILGQQVLNLTIAAAGAISATSPKKDCVIPVIRLAASHEALTALTTYQTAEESEGANLNGVFVQNGKEGKFRDEGVNCSEFLDASSHFYKRVCLSECASAF